MTQTELQRYTAERNRLNAEIDLLLEKKQDAVSFACTGSQALSGMPKRAFYGSRIEKAAELAQKYEGEANRLIDELNSIKKPMRSFIASLPKLTQRLVMEYRYLDEGYPRIHHKNCWSWRDIAKALKISQAYVRKVHEKIFTQYIE